MLCNTSARVDGISADEIDQRHNDLTDEESTL